MNLESERNLSVIERLRVRDGSASGETEDVSLSARFGLLLRRVVNLLEHAGHSQQERWLERRERGEKLPGVRLVSDADAGVDAEDRNHSGIDVRCCDEQKR